MLGDLANLFDWRDRQSVELVEPWKPVPLEHDQWPPNYKAVYAWRMKQLATLRNNPSALASAKVYYKTRPAEFIMHWFDTYDPRKTSSKWIPFVFFKKQADVIEFFDELRQTGESGLIEKCRDMGITWEAVAYSAWSWLFIKEDAIGWGSRKQDLVDHSGDPDSIFEKIRLLISRMPDVWLPEGFTPRTHATFQKMINPETGATITGEAGDNIGRGGRKSMYFKDESAHYERPEKIEAALGDNTKVQVDISSVNGLGNVFHNRREAGIDWSPGKVIEPGFTRVLVIDWRDHPEKTQAWYDQRKAKYKREGMEHVFAQEVDRDYSASIMNTLIPLEWINACVDAHLTIPYLRKFLPSIPNTWSAGFDVADEGPDRNAVCLRQWIIWRGNDEWGGTDAGVSTRRAIAAVRSHKGIKVQYDCIGVGATVKAEFNRLIEERIITRQDLIMVPWNAGAGVVRPFENIITDDLDSPQNKDFFGNMKAQAWWSMRSRCYKTFQAVKYGIVYSPDELISLDSNMPMLHQVKKELAQPTRGETGSLRTIVNKKPKGTKSPNLADAGIMAYFPIEDNNAYTQVGSYGG